jgi:hypothetical protein
MNRMILIDALAEFVGSRIGHNQCYIEDKEAAAKAYVERRYPTMPQSFKDRKWEEVVRRCDRANELLEQLRDGGIMHMADLYLKDE